MKLMKLPFLCLLLMLSHAGFSQILLESSQTSDPVDWAKPKEYTLAAVEIDCSQYTDKNIVRLLSGLTPGDKIQIPGDKISEAIKNLWKQSLFEDVKVYLVKVIGNEAFLKISVVEKPRLFGFSFTGNVKKNDADEIRSKIRFVREKVVTDYTLGYIRNMVKDYYVNKGFFNAEVTITTTPEKSTKTPHVNVFINVKKGKKVRIKNLNFYGNTVVKS